MRLTEITDDLTGAADSGSYFTARGRKVRICTNGRCSLEHETDEILTVNLSSRNTAQDKARQLHADLLRRLEPGGFYMKKIGTGFRGNDSYELDGLLDGWPDYNVFIVDNAPDLGTFTLYGNQYCEGEILPKSVYANDPIFPPTESYIPKILGKDTDKKIGLVDIDAVKGSEETLLAAVEHQLAEGTRILVFDAIHPGRCPSSAQDAGAPIPQGVLDRLSGHRGWSGRISLRPGADSHLPCAGHPEPLLLCFGLRHRS